MAKPNPADPNQLACDHCGRWYNHKALEITESNGEICSMCATELGLDVVSFPEQRSVLAHYAAVNRAIDAYNESIVARDAAIVKAKADAVIAEKKKAAADKAASTPVPEGIVVPKGPFFGSKMPRLAALPPPPPTPVAAAPPPPIGPREATTTEIRAFFAGTHPRPTEAQMAAFAHRPLTAEERAEFLP